MSCRAYAKRRGVSAMAVSEAIKNGRLVKSITRNEFGQPKIADPDLADREWEANTDSQKRINAAGGVEVERMFGTVTLGAPIPRERFEDDESETDRPPKRDLDESGSETVASATQRLKAAQADLAELKFKEAAGELVPARDVEARMVSVFTSCKTRLLAIPSRARQALPHLTNADVASLETLVREALEELTTP